MEAHASAACDIVAYTMAAYGMLALLKELSFAQ